MNSNASTPASGGTHAPTEALRRLTEMCRNGDFYQDYDLSWEVLGAAEQALAQIEATNG